MKHFGDITKIKGSEVPLTEIVVGGSPCQDLSVAGKRAGLAGERSGLFMEQIRIIKEMRDESYKELSMQGSVDPSRIVPRFMVWENVPGAFSSNKGEDFRCVLEETARVADENATIPRLATGKDGKQKWSKSGCIMADGWSIAWRLHDSQWFGVPQRRKRICVCADFGGQSAPRILFELRRKAVDTESDQTFTNPGNQSGFEVQPISESVSRDSEQSRKKRKRVTADFERSTNPSSFTLKIRGGREVDSNGRKAGKGALVQTELSGTLGVSQDQTLITTINQVNILNPSDSQGNQVADSNGVVQTLSKQSGNVPMVIEQPYNATTGSFMRAGNSGIAETLAARDYKDPQIVCNSVVRRLTPLECERLQGFPVVRKVRFTEMTKDEYIAWNINEGHIVVDTEYGKVFATRGPGGAKLDEPKELTGSVVNGYKVVSIRNGETKMQCRVHRIVWIAEHGIIPDGYVIDHINNDKADNRIANLQLLTATENSTKARQDGLYKVHEDAGQAKISDEVHDLIQYVYGNTDLTCRQMAEIFGISKSRVHQIIHDEPWTDIGEWVDSKGKTHKGDSDSPRYKALGNSIALPYWSWMAGRMVAVLKADGVEQPTMSSLFDGIGGFPLVFSRAGAKPIWASEIEEFPIAVTKIRFPEEEENK